jgi:hypothetical protein
MDDHHSRNMEFVKITHALLTRGQHFSRAILRVKNVKSGGRDAYCGIVPAPERWIRQADPVALRCIDSEKMFPAAFNFRRESASIPVVPA